MKMSLLTRMGLALALSALYAAVQAQEIQSEVEYYAEQERLRREAEQAKPVEPPVVVDQTRVYQPHQDKADRNGINPEYFQNYQLAKLTCKDETGPYNTIVVIPQYFNSRSDGTTIDYLGAHNMKVKKSRGQGAGVALAYSRKLSDMFSLTFLYEYAFMHIRGGSPYDPNVYSNAKTTERWDSHIAAVALDTNLDRWGRFNLSFAQAWDRGSGGNHYWAPNGNYAGRVDIDGQGFNISVGMLWYEVDFEFCNNWKLTPYAGWRSIYADIRPEGNVWIHLLSGGLKLSYSKDNFGFNIRAGVNHRNTRDDLPSFGTRAVAPGVLHFAHRVNMDRTVATYGVGFSYAVNKNFAVGVGYDGFAGKDTIAHMGTLTFAIPF